MDDDAATSATRTFARYLAALWDAVGRPSPYRLEKVSGARHRQGQTKEPIKRSTVYDHLHGVRLKIPQWRMVNEFLQVCRQIAEDDKYVDPEILGTDEEWRNAWREAQRGSSLADPPGQLQPVEIPPARSASPPAVASALSSQDGPPLQQQPREENNPAAGPRGNPAAPRNLDGLPRSDSQPAQPMSRRQSRHQTSLSGPENHILCAPEMGEEGGWVTVVEWLHKVGERINRDDKLVHVRTHTMIDLELPAQRDGVLRKILAAENTEVPSGDPLCEIG